jgi:hypothetical protein
MNYEDLTPSLLVCYTLMRVLDEKVARQEM